MEQGKLHERRTRKDTESKEGTDRNGISENQDRLREEEETVKAVEMPLCLFTKVF